MTNNNYSQMKSVQLREGTIRYYEQGAGEPVVFVHGLLASGHLWRWVVPLLSSRVRCIVPDWPLGSHQVPCEPDTDLRPPSLARIIVKFLDALDLRDVTLVGNNTGGALCQIVVTIAPQRIARLVLTNCDAYENFLPPRFRPLQALAKVPGMLFLVSQSLRFQRLRQLPMTFGALTKRPIPPYVLDGYLWPVIHSATIRRDVRKILSGISPKYTMDASTQFCRFAAPVLLAWGEDDPIFNLEYALRLKNAFPNAQLVYIEDAAALVPEDQPERLAELIAAFIAEHETEQKRVKRGKVNSM